MVSNRGNINGASFVQEHGDHVIINVKESADYHNYICTKVRFGHELSYERKQVCCVAVNSHDSQVCKGHKRVSWHA